MVTVAGEALQTVLSIVQETLALVASLLRSVSDLRALSLGLVGVENLLDNVAHYEEFK